MDSTPASLEGQRFTPREFPELCQAIDMAFGYRGDVTLVLRSGARIEGYIFDRNNETARLQIFPHEDTAKHVVEYADVVTIAFSGGDTASGKSWETWVKKKESERKREAGTVEAEMRSRGHL